VSSGQRWIGSFVDALSHLGLEPGEVERIAAETSAQAGESGLGPGDLFGPAWPYARAVVSALHAPIAVPEPHDDPAAAPPSGAVLLRLTDVGKRYGRRTVFSGLNLTVRAGEVAAVVGANGCGKSTLLNVCAGLTRASAGRVARCRRIGYVPQDGGLFGLLTPHEHFELFGAASGVGRSRARSTGEHLATRLSWRPDPRERVDRLSGGTRQKLNLVLGELHAPDLLLLDEPYQGFDQGTYLDFWQQVHQWRAAGRAIVVVTHLLHELDQVDHIVDLTELAAARSEVQR
jgi:ABC-type nitrate/sulfonate/bicarbonate transport system ATPase subunit